MRLILLLLSFLHAFAFAQSTEYTDDANFKYYALGYTNAYRAQHGAPALTWHPQLVDFAASYINACNFAHSVSLDFI